MEATMSKQTAHLNGAIADISDKMHQAKKRGDMAEYLRLREMLEEKRRELQKVRWRK